jgi:LPXTG-motif cell wall-anchored protein
LVRRALLASSVVCLLLISLPAHATDCPWPEAYDGTVETLESLLPDGPLKGNESVHIIIDCTTNVAPAQCAELNRQVNHYIQCRITEARRQATTASTRPTSQPDEQTVPQGELPSTGANEILLLVVGLALTGGGAALALARRRPPS